MEQLKLVDAGVFILKKKYWVIATAIIMAALMVVFCCLLKPSSEESIVLKLSADPTLDTFISQANDKSTVLLTGDDGYPCDDKVIEYVEKAKATKSISGRINPYLGHSRLSVDSIRKTLLEDRYKSFLISNGINAGVFVTITDDDIRIELSYDAGKNGDTYYNLAIEKTLEYLSTMMDEYVTDTLNTHKKLLDEDSKLIADILTQYKEAEKTANSDPLSLEKCRSLLSTYAQAAYNSDISNTVVMVSNQLLAVDLGYNAEVLDYDIHSNNSFGMIAVFSLFGLIIGTILGCFGVYVFSLAGNVCKTAKGKVEEETAEEDIENISSENE